MYKIATISCDIISKIIFFIFFNTYYTYLSNCKLERKRSIHKIYIFASSIISAIMVHLGFVTAGYLSRGKYLILLLLIFLVLGINSKINSKNYKISLMFIFYIIIVSRMFLVSIVMLLKYTFNFKYEIAQHLFRGIVPIIVAILLNILFQRSTKNNKLVDLVAFVEYKNRRNLVLLVFSVWSIFIIIVSDAIDYRSLSVWKSFIIMLFAIISIFSIYMLLNLSYKHQVLLLYMEKMGNIEAELKIKSGYLDALISKSQYTYEANITKDLITDGFNFFEEIRTRNHSSYTKTLEEAAHLVVHPDDIDIFLKTLSPSNIISTFLNGEQTLSFDYRRFMTDQYKYVRMIVSITKDEHSNDIRAFSYLMDVHEKTIQALKLQKDAQIDLLTGIYNKLTAQTMIENSLKAHTGTLFMIDIDNFKNINDTYGHIEGDKCLCALANAISKVFRSSDIVGRIGGDEFMAFMQDSNETELIKIKINSLLKLLDEYNQSNSFSFNISIGITKVTETGCKFNDVYVKADNALYDSKHKGKNTYTII